MSQQTIASALNRKTVSFVDINNDYDCVVCTNVADEPVRCSGLCAGIFCHGCMEQALTRNNSCPLCKKPNITAIKDVILRSHILRHHVYCINKGTAEDSSKTKNKKRKAIPDEKCPWFFS